MPSYRPDFYMVLHLHPTSCSVFTIVLILSGYAAIYREEPAARWHGKEAVSASRQLIPTGPNFHQVMSV
jgi:hypothetical protein